MNNLVKVYFLLLMYSAVTCNNPGNRCLFLYSIYLKDPIRRDQYIWNSIFLYANLHGWMDNQNEPVDPNTTQLARKPVINIVNAAYSARYWYRTTMQQGYTYLNHLNIYLDLSCIPEH